jgi:hypothetical protein
MTRYNLRDVLEVHASSCTILNVSAEKERRRFELLLAKVERVLRICSPVVAPGGAVIIKLASTNSGGAVPAVVPPENEIRGLVGEHLAVCQGLFEKK